MCVLILACTRGLLMVVVALCSCWRSCCRPATRSTCPQASTWRKWTWQTTRLCARAREAVFISQSLRPADQSYWRRCDARVTTRGVFILQHAFVINACAVAIHKVVKIHYNKSDQRQLNKERTEWDHWPNMELWGGVRGNDGRRVVFRDSFCRLVLTSAHLLSEQVVNVTLCLREVLTAARCQKLPSISTRRCVIVLNSIRLL